MLAYSVRNSVKSDNSSPPPEPGRSRTGALGLSSTLQNPSNIGAGLGAGDSCIMALTFWYTRSIKRAVRNKITEAVPKGVSGLRQDVAPHISHRPASTGLGHKSASNGQASTMLRG